MPHDKIVKKLDEIFRELRLKAYEDISQTDDIESVVNRILRRVRSELSLRSRTLLSDMLFELDDLLFKTSCFADIAKQNKFMDLDLHKEIYSRFQFKDANSIELVTSSKFKRPLKSGAGTFIAGSIFGASFTAAKGLPFSSLFPLPAIILATASAGIAMTDYLVLEPKRNKKNFKLAIEKYLNAVQKQLLNWFKEIESYYYQRVDEFKQTL